MNVKLVDVVKIWDLAPHSAFTGLTRYKNRFYCTFREGQSHMSLDGQLRIIGSENGRDWQSFALISSPAADCPDLRDPKIGVTPDDRLMLMGVGAYRGERMAYRSYLWFSDDGLSWSEAVPVGEEGFWMWNFVREGDIQYAIGHAEEGGGAEGEGVRLYHNNGNEAFELLTTLRKDSEFPCETAVSFRNGQGVALVRHEWDESGKPPKLGLGPSVIGVSSAPYQEWKWSAYQEPVGGPALMHLPNGCLIAGGRKKLPQDHTALWEVDLENGRLRELITLPSANDSSYPGFAWHDDLLWVSYYSSHGGKAEIYMARLRIV